MMVLAPVFDSFGELEDVLEWLQLPKRLRLVHDLLQHPGRRRHERHDEARRVRIEATAERHPFYKQKKISTESTSPNFLFLKNL